MSVWLCRGVNAASLTIETNNRNSFHRGRIEDPRAHGMHERAAECGVLAMHLRSLTERSSSQLSGLQSDGGVEVDVCREYGRSTLSAKSGREVL